MVVTSRLADPPSVFPSARIFAHLFFAALTMFAFPASDSTRFFTVRNSRPAEPPSAFPAARTPSNFFRNLLSSFSSLRSSCLIAAIMFIHASVTQSISSGLLPLVVPLKGSYSLGPLVRRLVGMVGYLHRECQYHKQSANLCK